MPESSLARKVYEHVHRALLDKRLAPGDVLDRKALAEELGVSVSPVVQAFSQLDNEGFLEILPRRGTRIRPLRFDDVRSTFLLRNALECEAARLSCGERVRQARDELLALASRVDAARTETSIDWEAEIAFHRALLALADCPGLLREYDRIMRLGLFVLVSTFSVRSPFPPDPTHRWHVDLVDRLSTPDPDRAEAAIRAHLEAGRTWYLHPESTQGKSSP